jgi:2-amino-4-hydroxy-6-hydroxymethyldihydropteridine diphosphokinase
MSQAIGLALGANLGDRLATLQAARDHLLDLARPRTCLQAPVYHSMPVACPAGAPGFLNTVLEIHSTLAAEEILSRALAIETRLGRVRTGTPNAPRTIDIDLLYCGDQRIHTPRLELPHPRLRERRFVLQPLADIRPGLVLPGDPRSIRECLDALADDPLDPAALDW